MKKAPTEEINSNFKFESPEQNTESTNQTSPSEFSVANDDMIMEDLSQAKRKVFTENEELAPLNNKLSKLEDQLYQYLFQNMNGCPLSESFRLILVLFRSTLVLFK